MARVVLIEDEASLARIISWVLLEARHDVAIVSDAHQAGGRAAEFDADVVVVDSRSLKDETAPLIRELRQRLQGVKVLDVARRKDRADVAPPGDTHADSRPDLCLGMPFHADDLLAAVDDLTDRHHGAAPRTDAGAARLHRAGG